VRRKGVRRPARPAVRGSRRSSRPPVRARRWAAPRYLTTLGAGDHCTPAW